MMMRIIWIGILGSAVLIGGCATMEVKDTAGVKAMLVTRVKSDSMKKRVVDRKPADQAELIKLYEEARDENNGWIETIKFDLQAKKVFDVGEKAYTENVAALSAAQFIASAQSSLNPQPPTPAPAPAPAPAQPAQPAEPTPPVPPRDRPAGVVSSLKALKAEAAAAVVDKGLGAEAGAFVNEIVNNILAQDKAEAEEARKRIYTELDKSKWRD